MIKLTTIRLVLGLAAKKDLHLEQLDIKTTVFHDDLDEEIYMQQSQGFEVQGKERMVCKLQKSLYGLKQVLRQWYNEFLGIYEALQIQPYILENQTWIYKVMLC